MPKPLSLYDVDGRRRADDGTPGLRARGTFTVAEAPRRPLIHVVPVFFRTGSKSTVVDRARPACAAVLTLISPSLSVTSVFLLVKTEHEIGDLIRSVRRKMTGATAPDVVVAV
jgi:hypothetical protein